MRTATGTYLPPIVARINSIEGTRTLLPAFAVTVLDSADVPLIRRPAAT